MQDADGCPSCSHIQTRSLTLPFTPYIDAAVLWWSHTLTAQPSIPTTSSSLQLKPEGGGDLWPCAMYPKGLNLFPVGAGSWRILGCSDTFPLPLLSPTMSPATRCVCEAAVPLPLQIGDGVVTAPWLLLPAFILLCFLEW